MSVPVTVKMRRGRENGSRDCLDGRAAAGRGGRRGADAPPALGEADVHRHRRPLAHRRARRARRRAGDRLGRRHLTRTRAGGARDDRRRGGDGRPRARRATRGCCARSSAATRREPTREEVAAELILFIRETVRELGERRGSGFLKKFYGWYLGRGRFPKPFKQELVVARLDRRGRDAPARRRAGRRRGAGAARGGAAGRGRRDPARPPADLDLRRRLNVASGAGTLAHPGVQAPDVPTEH